MYNKIQNIQKEIGKMSKSKTNPFYSSGYFDINMLLEKLQPLLKKENLVLTQPLTTVGDKSSITTMLVDLDSYDPEDKEMVKKGVLQFTTILPEVADAQKMGSAITYVRRYAIQSLFALISEDDDGNQASGKKTKDIAF
jgi:hypothetical protein